LTVSAPNLRDRPLLLVEALLMLCLASVMIAVMPFRSVARSAARRGMQSFAPASVGEAQLIARAIQAWGARVPWRAVCFQQGLAAQLMLRRRKRAATLYYGAAHGENDELVAHVWVKSGPVEVIGCEIAADYRLLTTFPELSRNRK
jgi:Transglutaminase-like superfamily